MRNKGGNWKPINPKTGKDVMEANKPDPHKYDFLKNEKEATKIIKIKSKSLRVTAAMHKKFMKLLYKIFHVCERRMSASRLLFYLLKIVDEDRLIEMIEEEETK